MLGVPRSGSSQSLGAISAAVVGVHAAPESEGGYTNSSNGDTAGTGSSGEEDHLGGNGSVHAPSVDSDQQWRGNSFQFKVRGKVLNPGGEDTHLLSLKLRILDREGICRTVEFPYNMEEDSAYSVATEMVEDLDLSPEDVDNIALKITREVEALARDNTGELPMPSSGRNSPPTEARPARSSGESHSGGSSALDIPPEMEADLEREMEELRLQQRQEEEDLRRAHVTAQERLRAAHGRRLEQCRADQLHAAIVTECTSGPKASTGLPMHERISQMESLALDGLRSGKGKAAVPPSGKLVLQGNSR